MRRRLLSTLCVLFALAALVTAPAQAAPATTGVKVYGTVFFPPAVFGGRIQWVRDFVRKTGSTYPVADKLVQVAEHYGFDGWFINQETEGGDAALATELRSLIKYARGRGPAEFMWYDAMTESGTISWQEALTRANDAFLNDPARVSDSMFLDFGWTAAKLSSSRRLARKLGRDEHELYSGIDTEANGIGTNVPWDAVFPPGRPHTTSLGIYRPEWTWRSSSGPSDFRTRDSRFWVGGTPNDAYFVPRLDRAGAESTTTIEVEAVSAEYGRSSATTAIVSWEGADPTPTRR